DEAKKQLKQILTAYDERLAETDRVEAANLAAQAAFPAQFSALKTKTILPALRELAEVLTGSGHESTEREQEESSSTAGGVTSAAISFRVVPKPFAQRPGDAKRSYIEITFAANRNERKIVVSSTNTIVNAGGSVGKRGAYEVDALTSDIVVSHVLKALEETFARP
ncbi:MAG: hypothetical protein ABI183_26640, partial [Polyangiaceae bacterium]